MYVLYFTIGLVYVPYDRLPCSSMFRISGYALVLNFLSTFARQYVPDARFILSNLIRSSLA